MKDVPILVALSKLMSLEEAATALEADLTNVPARLVNLERDIANQQNEARSILPDDKRREAAEDRLAATEAEYQRLSDLNRLYWPRPAQLPQRRLATRCREWLTGLPHDCILELCSPTPNNSDEPNTLDGIRNSIKVLEEQIWAIGHANPPPDRPARKSEARQFVERLGATASPQLASDGQTLSLFGNPVWPISSNVGGTGGLHPTRFLPLLAALVPDEFTAMLERSVDALPIDPNFIPEPERQAKLASLSDEILQLERIEPTSAG